MVLIFDLLFIFIFIGSSLNITYPNLDSGNYILRVVGRAVTGERAVMRTGFRIGNSFYSNCPKLQVRAIKYDGQIDTVHVCTS